MKYRNIILIIIILCLGLQRTMSLSSEKKQGWWDWLSSKWNRSKVVSVVAERAKMKAVAGAIALVVQYSGIESHLIMDVIDLLSAFIEDMQSILASYGLGSIDEDEAIQKIKEDLLLLVNNQLLYPTRSSKINVLLKKDEFLQYVNDQNDVLQDACDQLIEEISALDYSISKKAADDIIDAKIATIRASIIRGQSLTEQIKDLDAEIDQKQHFTIPEMQAYLSMYFRLKNKQKVEGKLTKEEKESQNPWEKFIVAEPSVD